LSSGIAFRHCHPVFVYCKWLFQEFRRKPFFESLVADNLPFYLMDFSTAQAHFYTPSAHIPINIWKLAFSHLL